MADMYMRNISDWRDATLMLSFEEKGYYDELLNLIYLYDDLLPDDDGLICRAMPVHKRMHLRLKAKLLKFGLITTKDGFYFNKRASEEVAKINGISEKNRLKANKRWAKSPKTNKKNAAAERKQHQQDKKSADAKRMLKVKVNSESDLSIRKKQKQKKRCKNEPQSIPAIRQTTDNKCTIDQVLNPEGKIPDAYLDYAREQGLRQPARTFLDWAGWWASENGRKAGARGWLSTWKARVRKDVDRQVAGNGRKKGRGRAGTCATTDGAKLALDRRRNRAGKI